MIISRTQLDLSALSQVSESILRVLQVSAASAPQQERLPDSTD